MEAIDPHDAARVRTLMCRAPALNRAGAVACFESLIYRLKLPSRGDRHTPIAAIHGQVDATKIR